MRKLRLRKMKRFAHTVKRFEPSDPMPMSWFGTKLPLLVTLHLPTRLSCTQADLDLFTGWHIFALGFPTWPRGGGGVSAALTVGQRMGWAEEGMQGCVGSRSLNCLHSLPSPHPNSCPDPGRQRSQTDFCSSHSSIR